MVTRLQSFRNFSPRCNRSFLVTIIGFFLPGLIGIDYELQTLDIPIAFADAILPSNAIWRLRRFE